MQSKGCKFRKYLCQLCSVLRCNTFLDVCCMHVKMLIATLVSLHSNPGDTCSAVQRRTYGGWAILHRHTCPVLHWMTTVVLLYECLLIEVFLLDLTGRSHCHIVIILLPEMHDGTDWKHDCESCLDFVTVQLPVAAGAGNSLDGRSKRDAKTLSEMVAAADAVSAPGELFRTQPACTMTDTSLHSSSKRTRTSTGTALMAEPSMNEAPATSSHTGHTTGLTGSLEQFHVSDVGGSTQGGRSRRTRVCCLSIYLT